MIDLIARLESASVGSQKPMITAVLAYALERGWIDNSDFSWAMACVDIGAFLDAALTLVPEGAFLEITIEMPILGTDTACSVRLRTIEQMAAPGEGACGFYGVVQTPALAVCIAAIKAREAAG